MDIRKSIPSLRPYIRIGTINVYMYGSSTVSYEKQGLLYVRIYESVTKKKKKKHLTFYSFICMYLSYITYAYMTC